MNIDVIRRYFDSNKKECYQKIDDSTAKDLNLDETFSILDFTTTPVGEQYLYNMLRRIPSGQSAISRNENWIKTYTQEVSIQIKLDKIFKKLIDSDSYSIYPLISTKYKPFSHKIIPLFYILQLMPTILLIISIFTGSTVGILGLIVFYIINLVIHYKSKTKSFEYSSSIPMLRQLIYVCKTISSDKMLTNNFESDTQIIRELQTTKKLYKKLSNYRFLVKFESDITMITWLISELLRIFFLSEVINLDSIFKHIEKERKSLIAIFEYVGLIDTLLSVSKMREHAPYYCIPNITEGDYQLELQDIYHPLIENCVSNSLSLNDTSYLVLGSNMSGKTSFIRTIGLNVIIAQTLNTSFAKQMSLSKQYVQSVIAVNDNLTAGHSYFLSEVLRVRNVIDNTGKGANLILLDELFKGTNTIERIAAALAVLKFLSDNESNRILVATHDIELMDNLVNRYTPIFFEENIENNTLSFDYKIRFEHSGSMNAIKILDLYDYPKTIVHEAMNNSMNNRLKHQHNKDAQSYN